MPPCAIRSHSLREGLLDLGVGEGFRFAIVPSETAEGCEIVREVLLPVDAEAVFTGDMPRMGGDVWSGMFSRGRDDLIAVDAHVGVVGVGEQTDSARFVGNHAVT